MPLPHPPPASQTTDRPLWVCPKCAQSFVTANLWHSCVTFPLEEFFAGKQRQLELFRAFLAMIEELGQVTVNVNKTRISIQGRVRFAGVPVKSAGSQLVCGFWLKRRIESPRFTKVELFPPNNWVYRFKLADESELDAEVRTWLAEAFEVGMQRVTA